MPTSDTDAFFHQRTTKALIGHMASRKHWTIYLGLGATVDRTGLTWSGLVESLLTRFIKDDEQRAAVLATHGPIRAATILDGLYQARYGDAWIDYVRNDLRGVLYGPQADLAGRLLHSVVEFALQVLRSGGTIAFVTSNYDDYLYEDLQLAVRGVQSGKRVPQEFENVQAKLLVVDRDTDKMPRGWRSSSIVYCVHIHGYVPQREVRIGKKSERIVAAGTPVIGEWSYAESRERSANVLTQLFDRRDVLILGSSVTDTPLVEALLNSGPAKDGPDDPDSDSRVRVAVIPRPSATADGRVELAHQWGIERLRALGVQGIYPDHYIQTAQLVHEVARAMYFGDGDRMSDPYYERRYGSRLTTWWESWYQGTLATPEAQTEHHELLADRVDKIRSVLGAGQNEPLKLEAWVRWKPGEERQLALWGSSLGTWRDSYNMRMEAIAPDSRYHAVRTFCQGAPLFHHEAPGSASRWKSYFGVPAWYEPKRGKSRLGQLPAGAITLAGAWGKESSAISEANLKAFGAVREVMEDVAERIFAVPPA